MTEKTQQVHPLNEILRETMASKGLTIQRLHQATEVPERYLSMLLEGQYDKMPALPYVRGYIFKIAEVLELEGKDLWNQYKAEASSFLKSSGKDDRLPHNRFAISGIKLKWAGAVLAVVGIGIYLAINANNILGQPKLYILQPAQDVFVTNNNEIVLVGVTEPENKILINGEEIFVGKNGEFSQTYTLEEGLNTFKISAKKILGREKQVIRQVIYNPR